MEETFLACQFCKDGRDTTGVVDILHVPLTVAVPCWGHFGEVGDAGGDVVEAGEWVVDTSFVGEGEDVKHGVRGAAHGDVECDGVVDGLGGDDVEERRVALEQLHERVGGGACELEAFWRRGWCAAIHGEGDAEGFAEAVHGVGGEHAGAAAAGWAGVRFELFETLWSDGAGGELADAFEYGDEVE